MTSPAKTDALAIEAEGLVKRFGNTVAVDGLDLRVARGSFYGLLGRNGAGKSTTVGLLTGLLRPGAGHIRLLGQDFDPESPQIKRRLGLVSEQPQLFGRLRGLEQLLLSAELYGVEPLEARRRAADLLGLLELEPAADALILDYSRGMRKKLAMACALIHAPALLFLDEPLEGVDALSAAVIEQVLLGLTRRGATVLLTTHILEVAHRLCDRVGIIEAGRLHRELDVAELDATGQTLAEAFREAVGRDHAPPELPPWLAS